MKKLLKKVMPRRIISIYHWTLANLGALFYGYPSKKLIVIGVTGTKGKSTTSYLIAKFLESAGFKVGLTSTIIFKIANREWLNDKKMTMLGRFELQKLLKDMVKAGCKYAIIETSSEGIVQYRNLGIDYDIAVFTNLSPEHIESHGSYNRYKSAKGKLFKNLSYGRNKGVEKTAIINIDDVEADYFLQFKNKNIGFTLKDSYKKNLKEIISIKKIDLDDKMSNFTINGVELKTHLLGKFNIYNIASAISVCKVLGVSLEKLKKYILNIKQVPGRMEFIDEGQSFKVLVDYAHEPMSMKALYSIVREIYHKRVIHIFGSTGGGRDKSRRPILGEIADQNANIIILTNDDPYTENQAKIIAEVRAGIFKKKDGENLFEIIDRKKAIEYGINLAQKDDIVLITGKGCEQVIAIGEEKLPWDDREITREALKIKK